MSDGLTPIPGQGSDSAQVSQSLSAGGMLREAREAVGLHVGALAVSMKVPVKKLEALESDRLDLLPDAVFVRALASSVCRTLKIDAAPVLAQLPRGDAPQLGAGSRAVNEPFYAPGKSAFPTFSGISAKPTFLWVLALLVGAIAVYFFPDVQKLHLHASAPVENISAKQAPHSVTPALAETSTEQTASPGLASNEGAAANQVGPTEVPMLASAASATSPATTLVSFGARAPTWVKVVDSAGTVQLMKILVTGEAVNVGGVVPLSVIVGAADSVDVKVRGQSFDLLPVARENVARFEVR